MLVFVPGDRSPCGVQVVAVEETTLFELYRRLLATLVGTYCVVRTVYAVWRWRNFGGEGDSREAMLQRYLLTLVLRSRLRRFWFNLYQVLGLVAVLVYLLYLHH
jgi:hypothetical protein